MNWIELTRRQSGKRNSSSWNLEYNVNCHIKETHTKVPFAIEDTLYAPLGKSESFPTRDCIRTFSVVHKEISGNFIGTSPRPWNFAAVTIRNRGNRKTKTANQARFSAGAEIFSAPLRYPRFGLKYGEPSGALRIWFFNDERSTG